ncbi:MAG: polyphosphate polymerase domain-containing protein [Lachnospiraceae bacterium]|nr:polyphosphate polymerase domain-containing protein [Lachnospiraceae bacterium]
MEEKKRIFRNEWKYLTSHSEADLLKDRLLNFLVPDKHAGRQGYSIRSLYFDDYNNSAYSQKLMGVYSRKKWRIRIYNYSDAKIALERKLKRGNYIYKESADISRDEYEKIIKGEYTFLLAREENLCKEFYIECVCNVLRPKVIVDYERFPLVMDEGTVRITFDSYVSAALGGFDIFDENLPKLSAIDEGCEVLEVKYTEFIPDLIREILPLKEQEFIAFSKYVVCYEAAHHMTRLTSDISKSRLSFRGI